MKQFLRETDQFFAEHMPPVTRKLFYINVLVFVGAMVLRMFGPVGTAIIDRALVLTPYQAVLQGHVWQFVTYMFMHGSFMHLFWNMLALFFFSRLVEQQMGGRRYLWFLLLAGIAGGIAHTALAFIVQATDASPGRAAPIATGLVGFSGAIFAILTAAVIWFPRMRVLVMFMFPVPLRVMAVIWGLIMMASMIEGIRLYGPMGGPVSELAHAVGVIVGIILVKNPSLLDFFEDARIPFLMRPRPRRVSRVSMGHPGRHTDPDDRYNDPHWKLDQ
jgi:membrane associated rhomboid family serine protease